MTHRPARLLIMALTAASLLAPGLATAGTPDGTVRGGRVHASGNATPYTVALTCLAERNQTLGLWTPRMAVGRIGDLTGRGEFDTGARVSPELAGQSAENFRPIFAGQVAGSEYFIVGGITELNYNIQSSGLNAQFGESELTGLRGRVGASSYVMNVAVDLRLVDSRSQIVVDTVSFQKQLLGREMNLGVSGGSDSVGGVVSGGTQAVEPLQAAVRTLVERGVFELLAGMQTPEAYSGCLERAEIES